MNPNLRAHMDRVKKAQGFKTDDKKCPNEPIEPEPSPDPDTSGAMLATSYSLLTILTITPITTCTSTSILAIATTIFLTTLRLFSFGQQQAFFIF